MKKVLKVMGIIFLVLVIGIITLLVIASKMQSAPKEYWKNINADLEIEKI